MPAQHPRGGSQLEERRKRNKSMGTLRIKQLF